MKYYNLDRANFPNSTGVYLIRFENSTSGKVYIGSAAKSTGKYSSEYGFRGRWLRHLGALISNKHISKKLRYACNKYGIDNLIFEILEVCPPEKCIEREQFFIDSYDSCKKGYNSRPKAEGQLDFKHSGKTKRKESERKRLIRQGYFQDIKKLYDDGLTMKEIGKIINLSSNTVGKILTENGVTSRKKADYIKKKVYQYDLEGSFIQSFESAHQASPILNIGEPSIRRVASGKAYQVRGFYFSYLNLTKLEIKMIIAENKLKEKQTRSESAKKNKTPEVRRKMSESQKGNNCRKRILNINQLDENENLIKNWADSKEIVLFYNLKNFSPVLRVLKGQRKSFKGCLWKLADPE